MRDTDSYMLTLIIASSLEFELYVTATSLYTEFSQAHKKILFMTKVMRQTEALLYLFLTVTVIIYDTDLLLYMDN